MEASTVKEERAAKTRPIKSFRMDDISAAIWTRIVTKIEPVTFYSVTFERNYVSKGENKRSGFFNLDDLPKIAALCQRAEEFILAKQAEELANGK